MLYFFQVDPRTVEMYRQGAKVQCRAVKVKHQAARRAIRLKQQRRWIFICDVLFRCWFKVQTCVIFIKLNLITVQSGVCQV